MKRVLRIVALALVLWSPPAWAQWAVIDVAAIAQMVEDYWMQLQQYTEQLRHTANQYEQIRQQVLQVQHAYTQVQQGIQNLQHFNLNYAGSLLGLTYELQNKLNQARMIGYQAQSVVSQAQRFYPTVQGALSGDALRTYQKQWAGIQREAAEVSLRSQAIQVQQQQTMQQVTDLMTKASQSQGNLDTQQALAQGQGLLATQLVSVEQQLATSTRLQTLDALQRASTTEATVHALSLETPLPTTYAPRGHLLQLSR